MPLDPSILTPNATLLQSIANPQPLPTVADIQAKQLALQNARLQSQTSALDLQQKQTELEQHQQVIQAFHDSGGDVDKAVQQLYSQGNPQAVILQKNRAEAQKITDDHTKAVREEAIYKADQAGRLVNSVLTASDDLKPVVYQHAKNEAERNGYVKPGQLPDVYSPQILPQLQMFAGQAQSIKDQAQTSEAAAKQKQAEQQTSFEAAMQPGKQDLQTLQVTGEKWKLAQPLLQNAIKNGTYQAAYDSLSPDLKKLAPDPATKPAITDLLTSEQQTTAAAKQQELKQGAQRLGIEGARLGVERMNAGLDLKTGQPVQYTDAQGNTMNVSPVARSMAAYKLAPIQARSMATAQGRNLMNQVLAVNPGFDIGRYEERYKTMKDLAPSGPLGQQAQALNTLIEHSNDMLDAADALKNGSFTPGNAAYNKIATWFGRPEANNFKQLRQYVVGETVKLIRGGGGSEEDVKAARDTLNEANSPEELSGAIRTNFGVAGGKAKVLNELVRDATGDQTFNIVRPEQAQIMQQRGYDPNTLKPMAVAGRGTSIGVKDPTGKTHYFKSQADADAFKKSAGLQ